jgi:ABC-type Na+ efflux pump permease subunit
MFFDLLKKKRLFKNEENSFFEMIFLFLFFFLFFFLFYFSFRCLGNMSNFK